MSTKETYRADRHEEAKSSRRGHHVLAKSRYDTSGSGTRTVNRQWLPIPALHEKTRALPLAS